MEKITIGPQSGPEQGTGSQPVSSGDALSTMPDLIEGPSLLLDIEPWHKEFFARVHDFFKPPKLPPLQLTSKPVPVKDIWGFYRFNKAATPLSLLVHAIVIAAVLVPLGHEVMQTYSAHDVIYVPDISPYSAMLPPAQKKAGGGGGGGDRSKTPPSKGALPKPSMEQLTPPSVVIKNPAPKLPAEPTVIIPPEITLPNVNIAQLGDPMSKIDFLSNGPGSGGGIGTGSGGGVGSGSGGGVGPGSGGGIGGGVFKVGGGVSAPELVYKVDPEYSEQARKAKFQGTVVLNLVVQRDGTVRDIKVLQSLGLGLDEKAIEAVKQWRFRPGERGGQKVDVSAVIEVTFRLL